ncbi:ClpXP protease specificity-enhancing factor [Endozoicomonas sp. GU-1]|uniref:ClpXP protease specificity-enhancing factor n=1 Tax=Endozoicomonas sp. GU-1 TaxID=3009078 RepID=UPI0022B5C976|nr:ClpXP protease specificity-enhancing factor [Endozoicomonas sp. GU-1]WBA80261.1 ClpXP protease specificity-enhancing factor [Endozoicomonas sp. GU-1]
MTMTSSRSYIARALYEWILDNDCTPFILVDAYRRGVEVPQEFVNDGQIVLNISPTAVRALDIGNDYIMFDGRFGGRALTITVPVPALMAIYAQENGQGMVFEAEPLDEQEEAEEIQAEVPDEEPPQPPKKPGASSLKSG